jgi:RHS repeat-associated protein
MTSLSSLGRFVSVVRVVATICFALWFPITAHAQSEAVEYYGLDVLGSVRVVFDANGNVLGRMDYGPFGQELVPSIGKQQGIYAGLFADADAGLDHAVARSYQVRTGRFSTVDPVYGEASDPQAWNRYAYALNNPIPFSDPSGLMARSTSPNCDPREFICVKDSYSAWLFWGIDLGRDENGRVQNPRRVPPKPAPTTDPPSEEPPKVPPPPGPKPEPPPGPPPKTPRTTCNSFGRSFPNTFGNRFRDTFWQTNNRLPGVLAPTGVAAGYAALRTRGFGAIPRALQVPGLGAVGRTLVNAVRAPSFGTVTTLFETAEWAKIGAMESFLLTSAAFEVGVTVGSAIDAALFHPCAK